jgi:hypothetical protein
MEWVEAIRKAKEKFDLSSEAKVVSYPALLTYGLVKPEQLFGLISRGRGDPSWILGSCPRDVNGLLPRPNSNRQIS